VVVLTVTAVSVVATTAAAVIAMIMAMAMAMPVAGKGHKEPPLKLQTKRQSAVFPWIHTPQ